MESQSDLEKWRQEIREIDAAMLDLVARRMELSLNIGSYKKRNQLPVKDFRVEKQIIEKARESALKLGLYPALAEDLMSTLIHYSVLRQNELHRSSERQAQVQQQKALIIGGAGRMGQWFASFYESLGYEIYLFDKRETPPSYGKHARLEEGLDAYELILLATPMPETNELLKQLSALKPRSVIVEICSLKSPISEGLSKATAAQLNIASLHPMFGPDTDVLAGKNIIFCSGKGLSAMSSVQKHFEQTSAHMLTLPLEQHDHMMSYALGAAHLVNLLYAQILGRSGESLASLKSFAGTTFLKQLDVTSRVVEENQDLYFDIQRLNSATPQLLKEFRATLEEFSAVIGQKDKERFLALMGKAQNYFNE